jgi:hypothetical protein
MRMRIALVSSLALIMAHVVAPKAYALAANYTVYYSCHVGPGGCNANGDWYGCLVGEWYRSCDGEWSGWGMEPYTSCAQIVDVQYETCGPDHQGSPNFQSAIPSPLAPEVCGPATPEALNVPAPS